jgi:hypothetical protein
MLQTMPDQTEWNVHVGNWNWVYVFSQNGTFTWRDARVGQNGSGVWKIEKHKVVTRWNKFTTWDEWDIPINARAATGKSHMKEGNFDLKAEAVNFLDPDDKSKFLERCNIASGKVQVAQLKFSAWLSGISVAYSDAYDAHNKVINDIAALQKLVEDMVLEAALRFLTGGVGGYIGGAMRAAKKPDFMIDAVKDLAKYGLSGPAQAVTRTSVKIAGMPASPHKWQNLVNERVSAEMGEVSANILRWRLAVAPNLTTFDASFDPADVVEQALVLKTDTGNLPLMTLNEVDKDLLQKDFEKGFLAQWIELGAVSNVPTLRDLARDKLHAYGRSLGMTDIDQMLDRYIPAYRPMFPPGSLTP